MDKLSVCRILLLQPKPQLRSTKPLTGPHAAHRPRVGHSCFRPCCCRYSVLSVWSATTFSTRYANTS